MAFKRIFVKPSNFKDELRNIPNDGNDYEVVFQNGEYSFLKDPNGSETDITNRDEVQLDHSAGGRIVLKAFLSRQAVFNSSYGAGSDPMFEIAAKDIEVHGFLIDSGVPFDAPIDANHVRRSLRLGGGFHGEDVNRCEPERIVVTDCQMEGDHAAISIFGSQEITTYTDIWLLSNRYNSGRFSPYNIGAPPHLRVETKPPNVLFNAWQYCHVRIDDHQGVGTNGPIDPAIGKGDGPTWGGATRDHHVFGTVGLEVNGFHGESTYLETRSRLLARWYGSNNHDLHCERSGGSFDKRCRWEWNDCDYRGEWLLGHGGGDGGGNLWLWYYHTGGPDYDVMDPADRPSFTFTNCRFTTYIGPNVDIIEGQPGSPGGVAANQANCQSSGTYYFRDCHFKWIDEAGFFNQPGYDITKLCDGISLSRDITATNIIYELFTDNVKWTPPPGDSPPVNSTSSGVRLHAPIAGNKWTDSDLDRKFSGEQLWARPGAYFLRDQGNSGECIVDGSFENNDPAWVLTGSAARKTDGFPDPLLTVPNMGSTALRLRVSSGAGFDFSDAQQTCTPAGGGDSSKEHLFSLWFNAQEPIIRVHQVNLLIQYKLDGGVWVTLADLDNSVPEFNITDKWGQMYFWFAPANDYTTITFRLYCDNSLIPGPVITSMNYWIDVVSFKIGDALPAAP